MFTGSSPLFVIIGAASGAVRQAMKALPASDSFAPTASPAEDRDALKVDASRRERVGARPGGLGQRDVIGLVSAPP